MDDSDQKNRYDRGRYQTDRKQYRQQNSSRNRQEHGTGVTALELVETLAKNSDRKITLLKLLETKGMEPSEVRTTVSRASHVFHLDVEVLVLKPQISLCEEYLQDNCIFIDKCKRLHICDKYITGDCQKTSCVLGHKWDTDHNTLVYEMVLYSEPDEPIEVCKYYNDKGCSNMPCNQLHLCLSLVNNKSNCMNKNCRLNHDVLESSCLKLLKAYGILVNASPKEILIDILEIKNRLQNNKNESREINETNKVNQNKRTVRFDDIKGDAKIPEICYYSVESVCENESSGCDQLHSTQHFHWQISEQGNTWYNLTLPDRMSLELSYCKPEVEVVTLRYINAVYVDCSPKNQGEWQANFNTMTIFNLSQSKVLKLRRLCTQNISNQDIDGNQFSWYFKDKNQIWIEYGNVNSTGEEKLKSSISSKDIEKEYKQNPENYFTFSNSNFNYSLDFVSMKQTNTKTKVCREVRRRPKPHLSENMDHQNKRSVTINDVNGDVKIPEICYYSVKSVCKNESNGCNRFHSTQHYLWQISEQGDNWHNLTLPNMKCLELSYCKPKEEVVTLRIIKFSPKDQGGWQANFNTMTISNYSQSKVFKLRRLCTQNISDQIDGNQFSWYFRDKNEVWIEYGNVDSAGEEKLKSSISSKDIEQKFKSNRNKPLSFNNSNFNYTLDFVSMKQTNMQTNVSREVRRRPKPHLSENWLSSLYTNYKMVLFILIAIIFITFSNSKK